MHYSSKVIELFYARKYFGDLEPGAGSILGKGYAGNERISMEIAIRVEEDCIVEARYRCPSCVVAIAAGSLACQMAAGMEIAAVKALTPATLLAGLGCIPEERRDRCTVAIQALRNAIDDYQMKRKDVEQ